MTTFRTGAKEGLFAFACAIILLLTWTDSKAAEVAAAENGQIRTRFQGCGALDFQLPALNEAEKTLLSLLSVEAGGVVIENCGAPANEGAENLSFGFSSAGRKFSARIDLNAPGTDGGAALVEIRPDDGGDVDWKFTFNAEPEEHFYGFGEKANVFDQRGKKTRIINLDAFAPGMKPRDRKEDHSYRTVPFFLSSRGYGFWLDDPAVADFDMDSAQNGRWSLSFKADRARFYVIAGPRLAKALMRYADLSGKPPLWPPWVFAPWKSRNTHYNRSEVEEDILRQRWLDIPGTIIVIDSPWETCFNDYEFNELQFPDPKGMLQMAHDYGYKILLWITPMVNLTNITEVEGISGSACSNYFPLRKRGAFVKDKTGNVGVVKWWKGTGSMLDFTNPTVAKFWRGRLTSLMNMGADGFKTDDGESQFAIDGVYHDGTPGYRMQNYYSYLYGKNSFEAVQEGLGGNGAIFQRSGASGSQKHTIPWPGDNHSDFGPDGIPSVVVSGQAIAMSGFPVWGHDIGGYISSQTAEVFIRWSQLGALSPVMQIHSTSNFGAWSFGEEAMLVYRKYAKLHTSLFPYFYMLNKEASETGMPMIRPLPLLYQEDEQAHVQRFEYLMGPDLLVAPVVTEGATEREVYFPKGDDWIDYWEGVEYKGGSLETAPAPLEKLPLFVRKGAIIPTLPDDVDTLAEPEIIKKPDVTPMDDRLVVRYYPDGGQAEAHLVNGPTVTARSGDGGVEVCFTGGESPRRVEARVWMGPTSAPAVGGATIEDQPACLKF